MLGVGGGFIIVPMLSLALHIPIQIAIAASLTSIVATSSTATIAYTKARMTNIKLGLLLETLTAPGAITGAVLASFLPSSILSLLFGMIMIYMAYRMTRRQPPTTSTPHTASPELHSTKPTGVMTLLEGSYHDQNLDQPVTYSIRRIPLGLAGSFVAGILSSMLGIGGGIVKVPVMNTVMGVPIKAAIATSTFCIGITAAIGALIYYYNGFIYPSIAGPLVAGVFVGAILGTRLMQRLRGLLLQRLFAVLIFTTAILMFLKAAAIL